MSEERDRNRLNIHEIKELSSYPRTAFLSTDCLSTRIVYLPMHCLSTRIVFLPTDSSYLRIVFLPTDCLPTNGLSSYQRIVFLHGLSPYTDCLPTNGFSFYQRTFCFTLLSWLAQNSTVTRSVTRLGHSHQGGHQVRHTPGAQSPGRSPGPSHAWGTVTRAVTRSVTRLGHSHQGGHQVRHTPGAQSPGRYLDALPSDQSKQE